MTLRRLRIIESTAAAYELGRPEGPIPVIEIDDVTAQVYVAGQLVSAGASSLFSQWSPQLSSVQIVPLKFTGASGDQDIFTVPAGKRATIMMQSYNPTVGAITTFTEIKSGGVYYQCSASTSRSANTAATLSNPFLGIPTLEAGETFALNCSALGLLIKGCIYVWNTTEALRGAKVNQLVNGSNDVYTVPAGKVAVITCVNQAAGSAFIQYFNGSGTNRTFNWTITPSGGAAENFSAPLPGTGTNTVSNVNQVICLAAGDKLSIVTDSGTPQQMAFLPTIMELPA